MQDKHQLGPGTAEHQVFPKSRFWKTKSSHLLSWWMLTWQGFILYLTLNNSQQALPGLHIFCNSRQVLDTLESPLNHWDAPSLASRWFVKDFPQMVGHGSRNLPAPHGSENGAGKKSSRSCFPKLDSIWLDQLWWGGGALGLQIRAQSQILHERSPPGAVLWD